MQRIFSKVNLNVGAMAFAMSGTMVVFTLMAYEVLANGAKLSDDIKREQREINIFKVPRK